MVKEKIKNLAPGAFFNAGPAVVTVLEHFADGRTLLAAKEPIGNRPFTVRPFTYDRTDPEPNPNNFAFSSLRYDLNTDFLDALNDAGVIPADKVLEAEWSLADHDGTNRLTADTVREMAFSEYTMIRSAEIMAEAAAGGKAVEA